ncbi:hypothetical protein E2P81_ATG05592 [Venturia nashicola]|uniref:Uncharacterized protein n=1 Tax=Venturia nashicola TaxID=86259 RepID=A0A4Z1PG75_9PEZI|nr:hypothetical protein E6O75_ATG05727 [Venturia nashicola]TLD32616.1 hypothetical protein E2P81_ATG05592 [Venturia nashicola]
MNHRSKIVLSKEFQSRKTDRKCFTRAIIRNLRYRSRFRPAIHGWSDVLRGVVPRESVHERHVRDADFTGMIKRVRVEEVRPVRLIRVDRTTRALIMRYLFDQETVDAKQDIGSGESGSSQSLTASPILSTV